MKSLVYKYKCFFHYLFPKITIRQTINLDNKKSIREVVDGQQRLLTIRDFINNNLKKYYLSTLKC